MRTVARRSASSIAALPPPWSTAFESSSRGDELERLELVARAARRARANWRTHAARAMRPALCAAGRSSRSSCGAGPRLGAAVSGLSRSARSGLQVRATGRAPAPSASARRPRCGRRRSRATAAMRRARRCRRRPRSRAGARARARAARRRGHERAHALRGVKLSSSTTSAPPPRRASASSLVARLGRDAHAVAERAPQVASTSVAAVASGEIDVVLLDHRPRRTGRSGGSRRRRSAPRTSRARAGPASSCACRARARGRRARAPRARGERRDARTCAARS